MSGDFNIPEVTPGQSAREGLSANLVNSMRRGILALEKRLREVEGLARAQRRMSNRRPRFQVWFEVLEQRLYVTEGKVAAGIAGGLQRLMIPTLGGTPITDDPAPFFDCSARDVAKTWLVVAIVFEDEVLLDLLDKDAADFPELDGSKSSWVLAELKFKDVTGGTKAVESFSPGWNTDITTGKLPPFAPRTSNLVGAGPNRKVMIEPGWLIDVVTRGFETEPIESRAYIMPVANPYGVGAAPETPLNDPRPPEFELTPGDTLYLAYRTNDKGDVVVSEQADENPSKPAIIVSSDPDDEKGVHYQPKNPDESEGVEGEYRIRLMKLETGGDIVIYQNSDVEHYHELPTFRNVGAAARIWKKRDYPSDEYLFRGVNGRHGVKEVEGDDDIFLDFWGSNVGSGCGLLVDPAVPAVDGPQELRSIKERDSDPQIRVKCDLPEAPAPQVLPEEVTVEGNGHDSVLRYEKCDGTEIATLTIVDGLAKLTLAAVEIAGATVVVPDCPATTTTAA